MLVKKSRLQMSVWSESPRAEQVAGRQWLAGESRVSRLADGGVRVVAPDDELVRRAFEWTLRLDGAAAYDSFYLALAEELRCDLCTADRQLVRAVNRPWVRVAGAAG